MRIHPLLLIVAACALAPPAAAQDSILRPGSAAVDTRAIPARTDEFEIYEGDVAPSGTLTLRTRFGAVDGRSVVVRTEEMVAEGEVVQLDSFALDRRTLAPLHHHQSDPYSALELEFGPDRVLMVFHDQRVIDTVATVVLTEPVFVAGSMDLLLAALPLAEGYAARLALYGADDGFVEAQVRVEGAEQVVLPGGGVVAWRVRVEQGETAGTYWMDRESHALVQYESTDRGVRLVRSAGVRSRARPTR